MNNNITTIEPRNALGIAALALGLVGVLFGLVPLTGFVAIGAGLVGVTLALANRGRLRRGTATNRKTTWSGLVVSLGAIALGIWGMTIVFGAVDQFDQDMEEIFDDLDRDLQELELDLEEIELDEIDS